MQSAIIIRARLPTALERLRRRHVDDATLGVPGHVTLLYPFVEPAWLTAAIRTTIATIAARRPAFDYRLTGPGRWLDTIYAAVEPERPFLALHRELALVFPEYPIYGRPGFDLTPHVTVAEGPAAADPAVLADRGWTSLPVAGHATALEVISSYADGRWRLVWRLPLGVPPRP